MIYWWIIDIIGYYSKNNDAWLCTRLLNKDQACENLGNMLRQFLVIGSRKRASDYFSA